MECPHCKNIADTNALRCENCNQRLFEGDTIEELWIKYINEKKIGAFLEFVYRAFNIPNDKEKEQIWQKIYSPIRSHIKAYLHCNPCKRMTWLLYNNGWDDDGIVHEVFRRKILSYGKDKKKSRDRNKTKNIFEPKSLKSFFAFINRCTFHTVIEIFRSLMPKIKAIEQLSKHIVKKKLYNDCLKKSIEIFSNPKEYSKTLKQRFIGKKGRKLRLSRRTEYFMIQKLSVFDGLSPKKILNHLNADKFRNKYRLEHAPLEKVMKKLYKLKENALIELLLVITCSQMRNGCERFREYFLSVLFPRKQSYDQLRDDEISGDEKTEEDEENNY